MTLKGFPHKTGAACIIALAIPVSSQAAVGGQDNGNNQTAGGQSSINLVDNAPKNQSLFGFNYGPPSSPAVDLLGLSTDKVTSKSSLGPFILSIPALYSSGGGEATALDISPMWVYSKIASSSYYFSHYGWGYSIAARLKLDLAISTGVSSTDVTKQQLSGIAVGASFPVLPFDDPLLARRRGAPRSYYLECLANDQPAVDALLAANTTLLASDKDLQTLDGQVILIRRSTDAASEAAKSALLKVYQSTYGPFSGGTTDDQFNSFADKLDTAVEKLGSAVDTLDKSKLSSLGLSKYYSDCAAGASAVASVNPDLTLGVGFRQEGEAGELAKLHPGGGSAWLAWRYPVTTFGSIPSGKLSDDQFKAINSGNVQYLSLGGALRFDDHAQLTTGNTTTPVIEANKVDVWGGLELYATWARFGAQYGYSILRAVDPLDAKFNQDGSRWLTSAAFKLGSTGFWIGATYGNANGNTTKLNDRTFLLTFYYSPPNGDDLFGNKSGSSTGGKGGGSGN